MQRSFLQYALQNYTNKRMYDNERLSEIYLVKRVEIWYNIYNKSTERKE